MAPSDPTPDPRPRLSALAALWPFLRPYRAWAFGALAALSATAAISLALPLAVRRVVDGFNAETALLDQYFAAAIGLALLLALGTGARYYLVTRLGERVIADLRRAVFDRVIGMSPTFFERHLTGEILSRLTADTTLILTVISSSASLALRNMLMLIGGFVLLALTSGKLTALVLLVVPGVVLPLILLGRRLRDQSRESQDLIAASAGQAAEWLGAAQTLQSLGYEGQARTRFGAAVDQSFRGAARRIRTRAQMTILVIFLVFSGVAAVLWVGAHDVRAGVMSTGALVQFVIYAVMVAGAVGALSEVWGEVQRAAGATDRLAALLAAEDALQDPSPPRALPAPPRGALTFEDVHFAYPSRPESPALKGVSFTVHPGERVAFVGPSGAGKTTLFQLLLRFYDPSAGRILLDGVDLRDLARTGLRGAFALVPQAPVIFAASAADNIRLGAPDAPQSAVEAAARAAAAHDFLAALPQGYDTYVGERGVMLSGGQKQRLALARALLRAAPVLLLDEATSALDAESERAVQEAVEALPQGRTILIIAHRLSTVQKADRIIVLEEGRVVAEGSHAALMAEGGLYARLARLQLLNGSGEDGDEDGGPPLPQSP